MSHFKHKQTRLVEQVTFPMIENLESRIVLSTVPLLAPLDMAPAVVTAPATVVTAAITQAPLPLGGNLNQQTDRIQDHPFVDLVKVTRGFFNLAGRIDPTTGTAAPATTDANGWPTEDFSFSVDDQSEYGVQITPGTYQMSFTGPAGVNVTTISNAPGPRSGPAIASNTGTITLNQTSYDPTSGTYAYKVVVPAGIYTLAFSFTNTGGAVKNIQVLQPGYNLSSYPVFTTQYLNLLKALNPDVLRFMDYTQTNNSTVVNWSDRTLPNQPTAATTGVSWEDCITLANDLNKGIWINVPAMATDDYVTQLATLIKNTLNPSLPIYVEYSNEVWNSQFSQYTFDLDQAVAEVQSNSSSNLDYDHLPVTSAKYSTFAERLYARRAMQISNIFASVWTGAGLSSPINSAVRVVLGGQAANPAVLNTELTYINSVYGGPHQFFYSTAIAPYIDLDEYNDSSGITNLTAAQVLQGLQDSVDGYQTKNVFGQAFAQANAYGLKLDAYEAGENTYGSLNISARAQAVLESANTAIVAKYLNLWYSAGGDQLNWYTLGARSFNTQFGTYSITDDITNYNEPKEQAYVAVRDETTAALAPSADAYVRDGTYATQNFGAATQLLVKDAVSGGGYVRTGYLKFNLAGLDPITSAFLNLYGSEQPGAAESSITIGAFPVSNSTWGETTITDANAPAIGSGPIATVNVAGLTAQQYTFDLTSYLQQQQAMGNTSVTIALEGTKYTGGVVGFNSREAASQQPQFFVATSKPAPPPPAPAAYTVTTLGDGTGVVTPTGANTFSATTLRAAIGAADAHTATDTINFASGLAGTLSLGSALPPISDDLTLTGPGVSKITVQRSSAATTDFSIFDFNAGTTATISGLTIANGTGGLVAGHNGSQVVVGGGILNDGTLSVNNCTITGNTTQDGGGGIYNAGTLTLTGSTLSNNADNFDGGGGGIANYGSLTINTSTLSNNSSFGADGGGGIDNFGTVTAAGSSISGNSAEEQNGGGIANTPGGTVTLTSCTLSGDNSLGTAGGVLNSGSINLNACTLSGNISGDGAAMSNGSSGITKFVNCTIAGNSADGVGGIENLGSMTLTNSTVSGNTGGGIAADGGSLTLANTIVAGNTGSNANTNLPNDIIGVVDTSSAYNLIGTGGSGGLVNGQNHNLVGVTTTQLKLGSLANNGGPTQTMALPSGSPAIDAGSNALAVGIDGKPLTTDQRGSPRISGAAVDIGAFESQTASLISLVPSADAYVRDGSFAGTNFGSATQLLVKNAVSGGGYVRTAYLKFNLAGLAPASSAVLQLYGNEVAGATEPSIAVAVYPVASSNWSESSITFANAPVVGSTPLASVNVTGTTEKLYTFDLTSYIKQQQALGNTTVTIALRGTLFTGGMVTFDSRESATHGPQLVLNSSTPIPTPVNFAASADTYVQNGTYAGTNYGTAKQLLVKQAVAPYNRVAYLKFDLTSLTGTSIQNATLRLFGGLQGGSNPSFTVRILAVSNTTWNETTLTQNNAPATGAVLASGAIPDATSRWYTFDLTSYLNQLLATGQRLVSVAIAGTANTTEMAAFNSREATTNGPQLVVTP